MKFLPTKHQTTKQIAVVHTLAAYSPKEEYMLPKENAEGKTPWMESYFSPGSAGDKVIDEFHLRLKLVQAELEGRNAAREDRGQPKYLYMLPAKTPASIAI